MHFTNFFFQCQTQIQPDSSFCLIWQGKIILKVISNRSIFLKMGAIIIFLQAKIISKVISNQSVFPDMIGAKTEKSYSPAWGLPMQSWKWCRRGLEDHHSSRCTCEHFFITNSSWHFNIWLHDQISAKFFPVLLRIQHERLNYWNWSHQPFSEHFMLTPTALEHLHHLC